MQAKLLLVGGRATKKEISLTLPAVLGRAEDAGVAILHPSISRQHCELFERDGQLVIRDNNSANGTYINNERIQEAVLVSGGTFTVGPLTFQAVYQPSAATNGNAVSPPPSEAEFSLGSDDDWAISEAPNDLAAPAHPADEPIVEGEASAAEESVEIDFELSDDFDGLALPLDAADRTDDDDIVETTAAELPEDAFPLPQDDDLTFNPAPQSSPPPKPAASLDESEYELTTPPEVSDALLASPDAGEERTPISPEGIRDFTDTSDVFDEPSQDLFLVEDELVEFPPVSSESDIAADADSIPDFSEFDESDDDNSLHVSVEPEAADNAESSSPTIERSVSVDDSSELFAIDEEADTVIPESLAVYPPESLEKFTPDESAALESGDEDTPFSPVLDDDEVVVAQGTLPAHATPEAEDVPAFDLLDEPADPDFAASESDDLALPLDDADVASPSVAHDSASEELSLDEDDLLLPTDDEPTSLSSATEIETPTPVSDLLSSDDPPSTDVAEDAFDVASLGDEAPEPITLPTETAESEPLSELNVDESTGQLAGPDESDSSQAEDLLDVTALWDDDPATESSTDQLALDLSGAIGSADSADSPLMFDLDEANTPTSEVSDEFAPLDLDEVSETSESASEFQLEFDEPAVEPTETAPAASDDLLDVTALWDDEPADEPRADQSRLEPSDTIEPLAADASPDSPSDELSPTFDMEDAVSPDTESTSEFSPFDSDEPERATAAEPMADLESEESATESSARSEFAPAPDEDLLDVTALWDVSPAPETSADQLPLDSSDAIEPLASDATPDSLTDELRDALVPPDVVEPDSEPAAEFDLDEPEAESWSLDEPEPLDFSLDDEQLPDAAVELPGWSPFESDEPSPTASDASAPADDDILSLDDLNSNLEVQPTTTGDDSLESDKLSADDEELDELSFEEVSLDESDEPQLTSLASDESLPLSDIDDPANALPSDDEVEVFDPEAFLLEDAPPLQSADSLEMTDKESADIEFTPFGSEGADVPAFELDDATEVDLSDLSSEPQFESTEPASPADTPVGEISTDNPAKKRRGLFGRRDKPAPAQPAATESKKTADASQPVEAKTAWWSFVKRKQEKRREEESAADAYLKKSIQRSEPSPPPAEPELHFDQAADGPPVFEESEAQPVATSFEPPTDFDSPPVAERDEVQLDDELELSLEEHSPGQTIDIEFSDVDSSTENAPQPEDTSTDRSPTKQKKRGWWPFGKKKQSAPASSSSPASARNEPREPVADEPPLPISPPAEHDALDGVDEDAPSVDFDSDDVPAFNLDDDSPAPAFTDDDLVPSFDLDDESPDVTDDDSLEIEFSLDEDEPDAVPRLANQRHQEKPEPPAEDDWNEFLKGFDK